MQPVILKKIPLKIEKKKILKRLGFNSNKSVLTEDMNLLIEKEIEYFYKLAITSAIYINTNVEIIDNNKLNITGSDEYFNSKSLVKHMAGCCKATILACTIGNKVEIRVAKLFSRNEQASGLILDSIASVAVETLAEKLNNEITQKSQQVNFFTIKRFSPGYGDWKLEDQKVIFKLIDINKIGIALTESCIMKPEKSITAIVGWKKA